MSKLMPHKMTPKVLPELIISDLDGTLTQTSKAGAKLASVSDKWGIPLSSMVINAMKSGNALYRKLGAEFENAYHIRQKVYDRLGAEQSDAMFLLAAACDQNIPIAILSNGPREWGERVLHRYDMHLFVEMDDAIFREDMPILKTHALSEDIHILKPHPVCMQPIIENKRYNLSKNANIWTFGDRVSDVELARNANEIFPYNFIPVAIKGTHAAFAIDVLNESGEGHGLVFEDHYDMACYIRPACETSLKKVIRQDFIPFEHIDSFHPS